MMTPYVEIDCGHFQNQIGQPARALFKPMERVRKAMQKATGYVYDNSHFVITDCSGKPALTVSFDKDGMNLWSARDGGVIGSFSLVPDVRELTNHVAQGRSFCCECKRWVRRTRPYSFAGRVCAKCYDPEKHLPPDTRGD